MKLNERVAIITEENMDGLLRLYGEVDIDDLSRIVNNHLEVVIDEIEEDSMQKFRCNTNEANIVLTDKDGKFIEVKKTESEY